MTQRTCGIEGCDRPHRARQMCAAHYLRWWETGDAGPAEFTHQVAGGSCSVDGCARTRRSLGLCEAHYNRQRRTGSMGADEIGATRLGPDHAGWVGEAATYRTSHLRTERQRGPAKDHPCACGAAAVQWAYDHADPSARHEQVNGFDCWYSTDPSHYVAMCVPCHRAFDRTNR